MVRLASRLEAVGNTLADIDDRLSTPHVNYPRRRFAGGPTPDKRKERPYAYR